MLRPFFRLLFFGWLSLLILLYGFSAIGRLNPTPYLVYLSDIGSQSDIMLADVNQGRVINISHTRARDDSLQWSRDGRYLAFRSTGDSFWHYFVLDTQNWQISELLSFEREHSYLWLTLTEIGFSDLYSNETTVFNVETGQTRPLSPDDQCVEYCSFAVFPAELRQLEQNLINDEIHVELVEIDWESGGVVVNQLPIWSIDLEHILFRGFLHGQPDVYMASAEGGIARRLTNSPELEEMLGWSHDRRWLSYTTYVDARLDVFVMNLDTMETYNLSRYDRPDYDPLWQFRLPKDN